MKLPTARKRTTGLLVGVVCAALALAGCSSGTTTTAETSSEATSSDGAFPVTIDTAYGEVTVDQKPEKIVVFTDSYLGLLDILGEKPVAVSREESPEEYLEWAPWNEGLFDDTATTGLVTAEYAPSVEAVAALGPDLILTDVWNVDEPLYAQLSQVAPTYVGLSTETQTSWQDNLASLAQLTGHDTSIVAETEASLDDAFAAAADRLPGLQGATFQVPVFNGDPPMLYNSEYGNDAILGLGLVPGDDQPAGDVTANDVQPISLENIERLNADVVFVAAAGSLGSDVIEQSFDTLRADPRLATLPATANGTLVYLTTAQWAAINGGTPVSYEWWINQVVPELEGSALNQSGS